MKNLLVDRVAFSIFGQDIYFYGLIITAAIVIDFFVLMLLVRKFDYDKDLPFDLVLAVVLPGIVGARLFSIIFEEGASISDFFAFRDGGMSIVGALIGGAVGIALYALIKKQNFFMISDVLVPLVIFAQSIGRWGNYFNSEVYGQLITNPKHMWFPFAVEVGGDWYQALFFYESVLNLIGAGLLIFLLIKFRNKKGLTTGAYLLYYGVVRFILEGFRQEKYILRLGVLPISKLLSLVMVFVGVGMIIYAIWGSKILKRNKEEFVNEKK